MDPQQIKLMDERAGSRSSPETTSSVGARRLRALLVSVAFSALLLLNLLYPEPKGPYDNGDFKRIFATFASGPDALEFWPPDTHGTAFHQRFSYFHRYWRIDGGIAGAALPSTSNLLFLPGRVLHAGRSARLFDLTANAAGLCLLLGAALFATLATLRQAVPFVALSAFALLMSDANVSGYLSSFYQESGAFVYLLLYTCALYAFWQRRTRSTLVLAVVTCMLLGATRFAYVPTACVLIAPVLAAIATSRWDRTRKRRLAALTAAAILATIGSSLWLLADRTVSQAAAYIFVFTTALPSLSPAERAPYLASLGVDPEYASETGKGAFDRDARAFSDVRLNERLGTPLLARALVRLAIDHPATVLHLVGQAGAHAGTYPPLMYRSDRAAPPGPTWAPWSGWSAFHDALLRGWLLYGTVLLLSALLGASLRRQPTDGWPLFFCVVAASFLAGSVVQAAISMFGNGLVDAERHNFLATMLLDGALIAAVAGLWQRRRARTPVRAFDACPGQPPLAPGEPVGQKVIV